MGVAGLWDVLRPAAKPRSLTELSVVDGFEKNPEGVRGFRLGIDASIWFFHAEYGKEGENPVLRTLFFRCATLMKSPFLPLFVFDGPKRPDFKRGKKVNKTASKLIPGMKQIVEAFGFEWRTAPGEAEAELAYLNRIGAIDGILSDDVDNFLFGATTVIRNSSNNLSGNRSNPILNAIGKDDKNHSWVFELSDITSNPQIGLDRGGLILIGLLSGGDYQQEGLERCGIKTAVALARCGFGETLYKAATTLRREQLDNFLDNWRHEVKHEIMTNSRGIIGRKMPSLARSMTSAFPNVDILLSYVNPITSESMGRPYSPNDIRWNKEPDIAKLAETCEFYFEWGYKEAIIKRFRTVIWHSAVLRILRRAVLDLDEAKQRQLPPSTPSRRRIASEDTCGTPSKMITKYFSTLDINRDSGDEGDNEQRLILKIHSARTHVSTDELPEYRLEIDPSQLVRLAESGVKGIRQPEGPDEWASEEDDDEEGGKKGGKKAPVDPHSHIRLWMPACMVKLVEPSLVKEFEEEAENKRLKKANKGQSRKKKTVDDGEAPPKPKRAPKKTVAKEVSAEEDEDELVPVVAQPKPKPKPKPKPRVKKTAEAVRSIMGDISSDDDDYAIFAIPGISQNATASSSKPNTNLFSAISVLTTPSKPKPSAPTPEEVVATPSPRRRDGIKDLTKKKTGPSVSSLGGLDGRNNTVKSFFPVSKTLGSTALGKPKQTSPASLAPSHPTSQSPTRTLAPFPLAFEKLGQSSNTQHPITDDLLSSPVRDTREPASTSSRTHSRRTSLSSNSSSESHIDKSLRKSQIHGSPSNRSQWNSGLGMRTASGSSSQGRSSSPSPLAGGTGKGVSPRTLISKTKKGYGKAVVDLKSLPVIEISSDSDEADGERLATSKKTTVVVPPRSSKSAPRPTKHVDLPPLARAWARKAQQPPRNVVAFIDLT
ncbi:hypothetical protein FA15DRAFT_688153 [Coprinopsis marcescibilis]|uniref:XPG-I domain-containing protein n=1 Tax=Coprinopsis marcescibilis TaxID=230819 RepID=A0A5C3KQU4_COPMA|nr:hypothetical protein FA15DRAFT_688153 [Coprinopsis marcescibilis]